MIESLSFDCQILPTHMLFLASDTHLSVSIKVKMDHLFDLSLIDSI